MKKIIALLLASVVSATCFVGCTKDDPTESSDGQTSASGENTIAETGLNIIENGTSEYTIVVPATYDEYVYTAAGELSDFLYRSSGAVLPTIPDTDLVYDENDKYISLGDTTLFQQSDYELTSDMRETGYYIKRDGNLVLVNAKYSFGTLCAAYDLLEYLIDFEVYAADEIYYEKKTTVPLLDFDVKFIPTFDVRSMNQKELRENAVYTHRLRMQLTGETWSVWSHATITVYLPMEKYGESHPEYYGTTGGGAGTQGGQVCYSNEDMRLEMVEQIKEQLKKTEGTTWISLGMEDNSNKCQCPNCVAGEEKYGNYAGLQLEFANKVAEDVDAWLAEVEPNRKMHYSFFAYLNSITAPAELNATTGKYEPISEYFRCRENVYVQYAPISLDFNKPLTAKENESSLETLRAWRDILSSVGREGNITVWTYCLNAYSLFLPLGNFGTTALQYKQFAENGVGMIYDQCIGQTNQSCLQALRLYTQSKLMYNADLEYNALVEDFMDHYYGLAKEEMMEYYNFYRYYLQYLEDEYDVTVGKIFTHLYKAEYWSDSTLQYMIDVLDRAVEKLEPLKTTDPERYQTLFDRIRLERLTPIYLFFRLRMSSLTQAQKEEYLADFIKYTEQFGINESAESVYDMTSFIEQCQKEIYG